MSNTYDPSKFYTWQPEDKFELSGNEFGTILNAIRAVLQTPEAERIMMLDRANRTIEGMMAKAVEQGTVTEVEPSAMKKPEMNILK